MFLPSRTHAAFLLSARKLYRENGGEMYMWTFTFVEVHDDWWYPLMWNNFMKAVTNRFVLLRGLRVIEVHPGGHGLHYHMLSNQRLPIRWILLVGKRWGIGRVSVKRCDWGGAVYVAKYLTKDNFPLTKGMRRWGAVGGFKPITCRRLKCESQLHRNISVIQRRTGRMQLGYDFMIYIKNMTMLYGPVRVWPLKALDFSHVATSKTVDVRREGGRAYLRRPYCPK
jgi:hypothetical protein